MNPGFYTLSQCELCLVFKRGKIPRPRGSRNVRQLVSAPRGPHSAKPDEVRRRIGLMFPEQRKIELFARVGVGGLGRVALGRETPPKEQARPLRSALPAFPVPSFHTRRRKRLWGLSSISERGTER